MTMTQFPSAVSVSQSFDLGQLNEQFSRSHPKSILLWCLENMAQGMVQTTAFGISGMVIMDLLYRDLNPYPAVPVIFLDTLHHFDETLDLVARSESYYDLDLHRYRPVNVESQADFSAHYGEELWESDVNQFHSITKVEPLQRAFDQLAVSSWITGRRRDQSTDRSQLPIFERDVNQRIKVNPLASWTNQDVWKYIIDRKSVV